MKRRDFLKVSSVVSAFGLIAASPLDKVFNLESEAAAFGNLYRAASKGRVMTSNDKGKSWQLHSNFGSNYFIQDIFVSKDQRLYIKVSYQNKIFHLVLAPNKQNWHAEPFATTPKPKA